MSIVEQFPEVHPDPVPNRRFHQHSSALPVVAAKRRRCDINEDLHVSGAADSDNAVHRALVFYNDKRFEEAKDLLERRSILDRFGREDCALLLSAFYLKILWSALCDVDAADQEKAAMVSKVKEAEETLETHLQSLYGGRGVGLDYQGSLISESKASLADNQKVAAAVTVIGDFLSAQGRCVEGKVCQLAALELDHAWHPAWLSLLAVYHQPTEESGDGAGREAGSDGGLVAGCLRLGRLLTRGGNVALARHALGTALHLHRRCFHAVADIANLHYCSGDAAGGVRLLREALAMELEGPGPDGEVGTGRGGVDGEEALRGLAGAMEAAGQHARTAAACATYAAACQDTPTAIQHLQDAVRHNPEDGGSALAVGSALKDAGRHEEAIHYLAMAVTVNHTWAEAWSELGNAYKDSGRIPESVGAYRRALSLKPTLKEAVCNLAHALSFTCDWRAAGTLQVLLTAITEEQLGAGKPPAVQPFHALVYPLPLPLISRISCSYAACCKQLAALDPVAGTLPPVTRLPGERLRVGYVSSDLANHPLAHLMQSVFGMHDRRQLFVACFALTPDDGSQYRRKIAQEVEQLVDVSRMSAGEAARVIAAMRIHVLVNLNGYTKGAKNEIFALRPAPVQVSYMGFCGTMGADFINYLVTDPVASPTSLQGLYTERLVHMPHSYFVNDHRQSHPELLDPAGLRARCEHGIPDDKIVLCNFNQLYKIDEEVFGVWCEVLRASPQAVLWLLRFPQVGEAGVRKAARAAGVADAQIIFTEVAAKAEHVRRGACADLFVDTLQCNAHTTACDILWSGTPLLTQPRLKMSCRVAASLVTALGMERQLVVPSLADYKARALHLIHNSKREFINDRWVTTGALGELRAEVETKRLTMPIFDTRRWVRNLETAAHMMWQVHERGLPPQHLTVPDVLDGSSTPEPPIPPELLPQLLPTPPDAAPCFTTEAVDEITALPPLPLPPNTTPHRHFVHTPPPPPPAAAAPAATQPVMVLPTPALGCLQPPQPQLLLVQDARGGISLAQVAPGALWSLGGVYGGGPPLGPMLHPLLGSEAAGAGVVGPPLQFSAPVLAFPNPAGPAPLLQPVAGAVGQRMLGGDVAQAGAAGVVQGLVPPSAIVPLHAFSMARPQAAAARLAQLPFVQPHAQQTAPQPQPQSLGGLAGAGAPVQGGADLVRAAQSGAGLVGAMQGGAFLGGGMVGPVQGGAGSLGPGLPAALRGGVGLGAAPAMVGTAMPVGAGVGAAGWVPLPLPGAACAPFLGPSQPPPFQPDAGARHQLAPQDVGIVGLQAAQAQPRGSIMAARTEGAASGGWPGAPWAGTGEIEPQAARGWRGESAAEVGAGVGPEARGFRWVGKRKLETGQ